MFNLISGGAVQIYNMPMYPAVQIGTFFKNFYVDLHKNYIQYPNVEPNEFKLKKSNFEKKCVFIKEFLPLIPGYVFA